MKISNDLKNKTALQRHQNIRFTKDRFNIYINNTHAENKLKINKKYIKFTENCNSPCVAAVATRPASAVVCDNTPSDSQI